MSTTSPSSWGVERTLSGSRKSTFSAGSPAQDHLAGIANSQTRMGETSLTPNARPGTQVVDITGMRVAYENVGAQSCRLFSLAVRQALRISISPIRGSEALLVSIVGPTGNSIDGRHCVDGDQSWICDEPGRHIVVVKNADWIEGEFALTQISEPASSTHTTADRSSQGSDVEDVPQVRSIDLQSMDATRGLSSGATIPEAHDPAFVAEDVKSKLTMPVSRVLKQLATCLTRRWYDLSVLVLLLWSGGAAIYTLSSLTW